MVDFPGPGKLRAAADVATGESRAMYHRFEGAVLQAAFRLKKAWFDLQLVDEQTQVNREIVALLGDLEKLAQSGVEAGRGSLQDLLRTQMEKERLQNELADLRDSRGWYLTQFNAALGLDPSGRTPPLPRPPASSSMGLSGNEILAAALARNPRLKGLEADVRRAEAAIAQAQRARIPDFSLGVMTDVKPSPVMVRPLVGMTVPIWRDKIAADVAAARASAGAAKARLDSGRLDLAVETAMKSYQYRESTRLLALLQDSLLPKARQALDVARGGYATGNTGFIDLIDAQRTLLDFRLGEVEARINRELVLAELSLIVMGVPPPDAPLLDNRDPWR
jgi:outer membrane protein TolC